MNASLSYECSVRNLDPSPVSMSLFRNFVPVWSKQIFTHPVLRSFSKEAGFRLDNKEWPILRTYKESVEILPGSQANNGKAAILDGRSGSQQWIQQLQPEVDRVTRLLQRPPRLSVFVVGDRSDSHLYVQRKAEVCQKVFHPKASLKR